MPYPKAKSRLTSHDVAKEAGVSQSVVSRAFTPGSKIASSTRKHVLAIAHKLGYHPNAFARGLVKQSTSIIGILMARVDNHFYPQVLEQFSSALTQAGKHVMFFNTSEDDDVEAALLTALQYQVEAMVITSISLSSQMAQIFADAGVPVVLFNRYVKANNVFAVVCDNYAGGREAAKLLLDGGHKRFAYVGGQADSSTNQDRKKGFEERLEKSAKALAFTLEGSYSYEWGRAAATELLTRPKPPDAIFCGSDMIAMGLMDEARYAFGLSIPDELAIIGFDDIPAASWQTYQLTTIRQPVDELVAKTLGVLTHDTKQTAKQLVPTTLIERKTTR